ncbi:MAG TPA: DUF2971 domain-containing protein [Prolixibacteraceae bacterium]|nr:DUF2971 domain-containing protein [Prolixibacteraceae bacterium]
MNIYTSFDEVETEIKEQTPGIIYKFRDWDNAFHKKILTEREIWFAHPESLNDPYDTRPPYNFIAENIDWDFAEAMIKEAGRTFEPHLSEEELDEEVEARLSELKNDPINYFLRNRIAFNSDTSHFDRIGVFSCCMSFGNEAMWAHYGNNHSGFAVGFNTIELARSLKCSLGLVNYSDSPIDYYILGDNRNRMTTEILQKSTKWQYEEEIRFYTYGVGINRNRSSIYPLEALEEIVFGLNTATDVIEEITKIAVDSFPEISVYKMALNPNGFGFLKSNIL